MPILSSLLAVLLHLLPVAAPGPAGAARPGPKSPDERWAAVHAARMVGGVGRKQLAKAKAYYHMMAPTSAIKKWASFAKRWFKRTRNGAGVKDAKRSGRPPKLSKEQVLLVATLTTQGTVGRGADKRPYCSMEEVSPPCTWQVSCPASWPPPPLPPAAP